MEFGHLSKKRRLTNEAIRHYTEAFLIYKNEFREKN